MWLEEMFTMYLITFTNEKNNVQDCLAIPEPFPPEGITLSLSQPKHCRVQCLYLCLVEVAGAGGLVAEQHRVQGEGITRKSRSTVKAWSMQGWPPSTSNHSTTDSYCHCQEQMVLYQHDHYW